MEKSAGAVETTTFTKAHQPLDVDFNALFVDILNKVSAWGGATLQESEEIPG